MANTIQQQANYWKARLTGAAAVLELPSDQPRTGMPIANRAHVQHALGTELWESIQDCSRRHGVDTQLILLSGWAALLARLSGQPDIVIGSTVSSWQQSDAPRTGNVVALRMDLSGSPTTLQLLESTATQIKAALENQDVPFEQVAAGLRPVTDPEQAPFFQIAFTWQDPRSGADRHAAIRDVELGLQLTQADDGVTVGAGYDAGLFLPATIERYLGYWQQLLQAMVADVACPVDQLRLLTDDQARDAVEKWNDTGSEYPAHLCIHQLFESQVEKNPQATALVHAGTALTYGELNRRANQLAHHLRQSGIGPDDRVAIYVDRGPHMVLGLLATLKAGAAYVPLDPTYPIERLAYTLKDSEPKVLLTQAGMDTDWRVLSGDLAERMSVLDVTEAAPAWSGQPEHNPACGDIGLAPHNLAYVLYTSGSTGKPKGVAMPHGPLVNLIWWQLRQPGSEPPLRTLQFAALGFDVAFQETFSTLCNGGSLFLIDQDTRLSAGKLFDYIVEHRIERLFLPYFALQMLAEGLENHAASLPAGQAIDCALQQVITAGEQLRIEPKISRFFERIPGCRLHNHYGPTETHVVTALSLVEETAGWPRLPSIGVPIANARVYLLDPYGQPVPHGVVGELYLAGPVVARGYLKRPDLTSERFLPDPFSDAPGARMYRTGDIGRWSADGTIELLGRKDFQVKIRGFRVELGEIEAQVMAFAGVREAGVLAREDSPGLKRLVAYFSPVQANRPVDIEGLRRHLIAKLPDYMVPVAYVALDALPLSPNGKLDRAALPAPGKERPDWAGAYEAPCDATEEALCRLLAEVLDLERIGRNDNFFDLGGTSLLAVRLLENIRREGLGEIATTTLFRDPSPAALARELAGATQNSIEPSRLPRNRTVGHDDPIAIVAMAGRFPGAADVEAFWRNLCEGRDTVSVFDAGELDASIPESTRRDPNYVPARGVIEGVEDFDAAFFGISPKEAELMDPQQRIFMELCWECIERAGHVPDATPGPVGVFAGMYNASYYQRNVLAHPDLVDRVGEFQVMLGNEKDYIATRVAHKLNLTGPAISVHTACSTSLVAICQAVDSLRAGQCDMALAGGIAITCPVRSGYLYQEGAMLSPDGHTRTFDADAQGTVFSDGAAVLLLKRLSDAIADGNPVHALIRGVAVNNDGGNKASFTAPSSAGQAAVIAMAHRDAGIHPRSISYVEAHGTATPVGDPIEIEGLTQAFRLATEDVGFCRVGSVKSNVGHLLMAAGAAGTIKTALAMRERRIPGTAHFNSANPSIDFSSTPFMVSGSLDDWTVAGGMPLRAGVSSFGVGGTNAHVVMEEAPALAVSEPAVGPQLLVLSARTPAALAQASVRLAHHLEAHPDANLADVSWTLVTGRKSFAHRLAVAADDAADAVVRLRSAETASAAARSRPARSGGVVFMFPGQGAQYPGMGRELYASEPLFREAFDECAEGLFAELRFDLRDVVFGGDAEALLPTSVMQPAIFSLEYSLARLWMGRGITPVAMVGHSVGEFVAATLAGVFTLGDALKLVARRGRLMQAQPSGAMLSVRMPLEALQERLPQELSLAAENAPGACVVSGPHDAIARFQARLEADGVACRALHTSHAFHSAMMDPVVDVFRIEVDSVPRAAPRLPLVSTATGEWLDADSATSADYWARHLREPVRFSTALGKLIDGSAAVLLEVGPRHTLAALARQQPGLQQHQVAAVATLADSPASEARSFRQAVGQLWAQGASLDPGMFDRRGSRRRLLLPTYPFERQRHWVEAAVASSPAVLAHRPVAANSMLEKPELHLVTATEQAHPAHDDRAQLVSRIREVFEDAAGFPVDDADTNFIELGLDSLVLTQIALRLQKTFGARITFRQLMGECATLNLLAGKLESEMPEANAASLVDTPAPFVPQLTGETATQGDYLRHVIDQQMVLMQRQLAALDGEAAAGAGLRQQIIEQQQVLMTRQLGLLAGAAAESSAARMPVAGAEPPQAAADHATRTSSDFARLQGIMDARYPAVSGARLGRDPEGRPAWYVANPERPGKFLKVGG